MNRNEMVGELGESGWNLACGMEEEICLHLILPNDPKVKFSDARPFLYHDGSLRDIYVTNATSVELDRFLEYARPFLRDGHFLADWESIEVPSSYGEVMAIARGRSVLMTIPVGTSTVNCHFFSDNELELDFRPSDFDDEANWNALSHFLQNLADRMGRDVLVTAENDLSCVHVRYEPASGPGAL